MEYKIGQIFEMGGIWYQCVESQDGSCKHCDMNFEGKCPIPINECTESGRSDKAHTFPLLMNGDAKIPTPNGFAVIIKQNKEDMEEKKLNLKPFDIQKAREGKPVCTRDGRKARILCYDFKQNEEYPILVAVENKDGKECALLYSNDGISEMYKSSNNELAMLPEKKEGWIVVRRSDIYENEEIAKEALLDSYGGMMIRKITWEE